MVYYKKSLPPPSELTVLWDKAKIGKAAELSKSNIILQRLNQDFKSKCYICGSQKMKKINIEHFKPHKGDLELKYDWGNLFLACAHCNQLKGSAFENLLDCTKKKNYVDKVIQYDCRLLPFSEPQFMATMQNPDKKTIATIELYTLIFSGSTPESKLEATKLKDELRDELEKFCTDLLKYIEYMETDSEELKNHYNEIIRIHLSNSKPFTEFKRWQIRNNTTLFEIFGSYCSDK